MIVNPPGHEAELQIIWWTLWVVGDVKHILMCHRFREQANVTIRVLSLKLYFVVWRVSFPRRFWHRSLRVYTVGISLR